MEFIATKLKGAYIIELALLEDERGFFARSFCREEFAAEGLVPCIAQCNISFSKRAHTLRGMHYQESPHAEAKLVRCTKGEIYDVIIDLRPQSPTYRQWEAFELSGQKYRALYIPEGFAHGFQTLSPDCEVFYQMSEFYHPESARGVRWNDPTFGITWPSSDIIISEQDAGYPLWGGK